MDPAGWEQDAVRQARLGRPGAYARLMVRYAAPVRHAVLAIVRDDDLARDLTQQAFIAAWEHLDRYDPRHRFFSWVYRIALNLALNAVRDGRRTCTMDGLDPPSGAPSPEERLLARERSERMRRALGSLPAAQRILLALHYDLDLGCAEIGRILGLPATTVKARLHAARGRLRRQWRRQERVPYMGAKPWSDQ